MPRNAALRVLPLLAAILLTTPGVGFGGGSEYRTIAIDWDPNPGPGIAGYRVHYGKASRDYDFFLDVGAATSATIHHLEPGTAYYVAVTAYNAAGLESSYSQEAVVQLPAAEPPVLESILELFEAEDAVLAPPVVGASDGTTSWVEPSGAEGEGSMLFEFESASAAGAYLWCRVKAPAADADSVYLSVNGLAEQAFHFNGIESAAAEAYGDGWVWRRYQSADGAPLPLDLVAGTNSLALRTRETGWKIDRVVLAGHPDFAPDDALPRTGRVIEIVRQPADRDVNVGDPASFAVEVVSNRDLSYQWRRDGATLSGAGEPALDLGASGFDDAGGYSVIVWSGTKAVVSETATLRVLPASPIRVVDLSLGSDRTLQFDLAGVYGPWVKVYASSDLDSWTLIANVPSGTGLLSIPDPAGEGEPNRYYRLETPDP